MLRDKCLLAEGKTSKQEGQRRIYSWGTPRCGVRFYAGAIILSSGDAHLNGAAAS